jgi:hypothetical protein
MDRRAKPLSEVDPRRGREQIRGMVRRLALGVVFVGLGCAETPCPNVPEDECPDCSAAPPSGQVAVDSLPGQEPIDIKLKFPEPVLEAAVGQKVFAPYRSDIDDIEKEGLDHFTVQLRPAVMRQPGKRHSLIENGSHALSLIPNLLVVAVPPEDRAKPGDAVLVYREDGSDMDTRAIVVPGGSEQAPMARRITTWDAEEPKVLAPGTFMRLEPWAPGTYLGCTSDKDDGRARVMVIRVEGDAVLGVGWANHPRVDKKAMCIAAPPVPKLQAGDAVQVPIIDSYRPGTVKSIAEDAGYAEVEYKWGDEMQTEKFEFGRILPGN